MKIVIFGGTGFVGKQLKKTLESNGHEAVVADVRRGEEWKSTIKTADAVVNLAGEPIFGKRWNRDVKAAIFDSRQQVTQQIVEAMGAAKAQTGKPAVLVNASAVGYYGPHWDNIIDETGSPSSDFLGKVCEEWEHQAKIAQNQHHIRTVILRIGVVLGNNGGALAKLLPPFKAFVGGPVGSGKQWLSWIHIDDLVGLILFAIENSKVQGPMNATAPEPVTNKVFSSALGRALSRPSLLPMPGFALFLALGEAAEVLVNGQRVLPKAALNYGYKFKFSNIDEAFKNLLS